MVSEQCICRSLVSPYYSARIKYRGYRFDSRGCRSAGGATPRSLTAQLQIKESWKNFLDMSPKIHNFEQLKNGVHLSLVLKGQHGHFCNQCVKIVAVKTYNKLFRWIVHIYG